MSQQFDVGSQNHQSTSSSLPSFSFKESLELPTNNTNNKTFKQSSESLNEEEDSISQVASGRSSVTTSSRSSSSDDSVSLRVDESSSKSSIKSKSHEKNIDQSKRNNQNTPEPESTSWTTDDEEESEVEESDLLDDERNTPSPESEPPTPPRPPSPIVIPKKPLSCLDRYKLRFERELNTLLQNDRKRYPWCIRQILILMLRFFVFGMRYHREICIIFLLFASGLASFRTGPMKTRSTPPPKPFFSDQGSQQLIKDYYRGEYVRLVQNQIPLGPAFVLYYAPWDSESVAARSAFTKVAHYFNKSLPGQVRFFAVNCWWPEGECRKNYKNLSHFPIFVGHLEKHSGIIYSGPIRAELMIKFINSLLKPITRIDTEEEVWRFRAQHDAIMLGYFNFTDIESTLAYETYLQMALRNFEADPFGQVGFGLFLRPELAEKFFLTSSNVISLVLFNEIHTAKWTGDRQTQGLRGPVGQVANWVIERTKKTPISWAYQIRTGFANRPVALGPMDLADELTKGPVMLLITRRYFPSSYSPFYAQLKEVALDYFNCNKSGNVTKLRRTIHKLNSEWISLRNSVSKVCGSRKPSSVSEACAILSEQLQHWDSKKAVLQRESLASYEAVADSMNFTGLSCVSERQFKFLAIDPVDMPYFVELGLSGLGFDKTNSDPLLFIIDAPNDIVLPFTSFNISTLAELIYDYTSEIENGEEGGLIASNRYWVETPVPRPVIPHLPPQLDEGYSFIKEIVGASDLVKKKDVELTKERKLNLVKTITSEDVLKYLNGDEPFHEPNPLFVMFTAKFCGLCGVGLANFVELSRFLSEYYDLGVNITFAKLDMFKNSLPRELMPTHLPTYVYFPPENRTNSRVFPSDEIATTKTLLQFLLAELDPETRVKLSLLSPGCSAGDEECSQAARKRLQSTKCSTTTTGSANSRNSSNSSSIASGSSSSPRENCLNANKASVSDRIHQLLEDIQNGFHSHVQMDVENQRFGSVFASSVFNVEKVKTQDLEHLRSMKLTLDVS